MKKIIITVFLILTVLATSFAQVSFTNETSIQFASDAAQEKNAGVDWLRNQFDISGEFEKFSFNGRLRLQVSPVGNRLFSEGATIISGFDYFPADDAWIQANAYIRPVQGLEFAFGTNIDYSLGTGSNWGDYETGDYGHYIHQAYFGKTDWAKTGIAVKYEIAGFEIGIALPTYSYDDTTGIQLALTKTTFALKYTLENIFSIGGAYFADFKKDSPQSFTVNLGLEAIKNVPLNIFADYTTADKSWTHENGIQYPANEYLNVGINIPVTVNNFVIEPEFAYTVLLGSDYKSLNATNPWFAGLLLSYEFEHLMPRLWFSYAAGYSKQESPYRMDVKPEIFWKTKYGTLGAAFNLIVQKNPDPAENALGTYVGWELPISWTIMY